MTYTGSYAADRWLILNEDGTEYAAFTTQAARDEVLDALASRKAARTEAVGVTPPVADVGVVASDDNSDYLRLVVEPKHGTRTEYRISIGAADVLFHELAGRSALVPATTGEPCAKCGGQGHNENGNCSDCGGSGWIASPASEEAVTDAAVEALRKTEGK